MSGIRKRRADTLTPAFGAPRPQAPDGGSQGAGGSLRNSSDPLGSIAAPGRTRPTGSITDDPSGLPPEGLDTTPSVSDPVEMRMARARRMGFDTETPLYHGTDTSFDGFSNDVMRRNDSGFYGRGTYFTTEPGEAAYYAETRPRWDSSSEPVEGANIVPAFARGRLFEVNDGGNMTEIVPQFLESLRGMEAAPRAVRELTEMWDDAVRNVEVEQIQVQMDPRTRQMNYNIPDELIDADGVATVWRDATSPVARYYPSRDSAVAAIAYNNITRSGGRFPLGVDAAIQKFIGADEFTQMLRANGYDGVRAGDEVNIFDPSNIRSRFAAFDPARSNSRDLLAGIAAPAAVGGALSERRRQ